MTGLLNGSTVPWDFVSGVQESAPSVDPLVAERARQRRAEAIAQAQQAAADAAAEFERASQLVAPSMADLSRNLTTFGPTPSPIRRGVASFVGRARDLTRKART